MARINIPNHQHAEIALTSIYITASARAICGASGVAPNLKMKDLNDAQVPSEQVGKFIVEGDLCGSVDEHQTPDGSGRYRGAPSAACRCAASVPAPALRKAFKRNAIAASKPFTAESIAK